MDKHTFIGKRKVGSTDISDFTDFQGIGQDPLYKRYDSVNSIIKRTIDPRYIHFLAAPNYSTTDDAVNWYIDEWKETPEILTRLEGEQRVKYQRIKDQTVAHYKQTLNKLSGEDLQVMACALRYIDDDFIFCCDGKVYLLAWGMTPDTRKHISKGELVHESPSVIKHKVTFDVGEHGALTTKISGHTALREGTVISVNDLPAVEANKGYTFSGWEPNPVGVKVTSDMTFTAKYSEAIPVPPPIPTPPPPRNVTCRFNAGDNGSLSGQTEITKIAGSTLMPHEIPVVTPRKGYIFKGWDFNPVNFLMNQDKTFNAIYEKRLPWYKRFWLWLTSSGFLKWLLIGLGALLLLLLFSLLFRNCHGCRRAVNGVVDMDRIVNAAGDTIDNNGAVRPIELVDGKLPEDSTIVAPVRDEDGALPPIVRQPGVPAVIGNRLFLFLEDENDSVDALAADFKKAYPGDQYNIIGYDREVKLLLIQIPENERDEIRKTINSRIPNHRFLVFDEEVYELNGFTPYATGSTPGWHLKAVKVQEGWQITQGDPTVTVAVVDDGIDASHPMFKDRIVNAYNIYTQDNRLSKGVGHGTHTAGLAVGSTQYINQGAAGIAPNCRLTPVQVIDNGMCPLSALVAGIMYSVHKGADVVNISIGPSFQGLNEMPIDMQREIARTQFKNVERLFMRVCSIATRRNCILVFAAGNDDILSSIPPENRSQVAIAVGAVDQNLYPTDFTNYGPCTDISAPGKDIYSSFPVQSFSSCDGTSMAAPIVTGTIALMKSLKRDLTVEQARNVLYKTGCDVYGYMPPMVQVNLALEAVKRGDFSPPAPRTLRPVPGAVVDDLRGDVPSSWVDVDPTVGIIISDPVGTTPVVDPVTGEVITPVDGTTPPAGDVTTPGRETTPPEVADETTPATQNETDYEAIRRLIAKYKKKISELEGQLPENKK